MHRSLPLALLASLWFAAPVSAQTPSKPNIVVILLDDVAPGDIPALRAAGLMPNFDLLASESYEFRNSFAVGALGAATRASFLTGRYPHNHKEIGGEPWLGEAPKFSQTSTVATWLANSGYLTALVGRHTTGYGYATTIAAPPGWSFWAGLIDPSTWSVSKYSFSINGSVLDFAPYNTPVFQYHSTEAVAGIAGLLIQNVPTTTPFFLMITPPFYNREVAVGPDVTNECSDPSDLFFGGNYWGVTQRPAPKYRDTIFGDRTNFALPRPPSFNEEDVSDKPAWLQTWQPMTAEDIDCREKSRWRRLEGMRSVDELLGYVMGELKKRGLWENTVLVFTADNGLLDGEHRFPEKVPAYEEVIRVPLLVRARSGVRQTIDAMVLNTDLAPTIAALAQTSPAHLVDGRSLVPLMQDPTMAWRKMALFEHIAYGGAGVPTYNALRVADGINLGKFVHYPTVTAGVRGEYYNLAADPYEMSNLYADTARQSQMNVLQSWLNAMKTCNSPGGWSCALLENMFSFPK